MRFKCKKFSFSIDPKVMLLLIVILTAAI